MGLQISLYHGMAIIISSPDGDTILIKRGTTRGRDIYIEADKKFKIDRVYDKHNREKSVEKEK